jgi:tetratricopeptide (TPR) repeat protein
MPDNQRLEDLRRRVQQDPSSIAFAQLAEEYRRSGQSQEAVDVCRAGLAIHPAYLSARVTLGRALLDLQHLEDAQRELEHVLKSAPENLAAIRGLAEIHHRSGSLAEALVHYRAALALARNDPDLEETVNDLARQLEPDTQAVDAGLSFEDVREEVFLPSVPSTDAGAEQTHTRALRTIAALEQWLQAIHVTRVERHA